MKEGFAQYSSTATYHPENRLCSEPKVQAGKGTHSKKGKVENVELIVGYHGAIFYLTSVKL
jgi:hypothetical protein